MKQTIKKNYESPEVMIVEMKTEGIICESGLASPTNYNDGGDPFEF